MPIHISTETFKAQELRVFVSSDGYFTIENKRGTRLAGAYELKRALQTAKTKVRSVKRKRVAIPFKTSSFENAVAKGRHETTGKILVYIEGSNGKGRNEQWDLYQCREVLKPDLTPKDEATITSLFAQKKAIQEKIDKWEDEHTFDLINAVYTALQELDEKSDPES